VTSADFQASDCSAYNVCTTTFPQTCLRRPSGSHGTSPTACYRDLQHIAVDLFRSGDSPKKDCMSLFIRKEDQQSGDRLLATACSNDYIRPREKVASRQLVRRESAHDANKTIAKAKWPKSGALLNDPHPKAGSVVTRRLPLNS
jgi:hypothetical protein